MPAKRDYSVPATYDWAEAFYHDMRGDTTDITNEAGLLAWGESYVLQSYLTMYQSTRDIRYLDKFVETAGPVAAATDNIRGDSDYRGESNPVWGCSAPYTAQWVDLLNMRGEPVVRLRSASKSSNPVELSVRQEAEAPYFEVRTSVPTELEIQSYSHLSLDPASATYLIHRLATLSPSAAALTAVELRPSSSRAPEPLASRAYRMTNYRYAFAAHTGMLAAPLAQFAALIADDSTALRRRYARIATELLTVARSAIHSHDGDWRDADKGQGLYVFAKGAPVRGDGTHLPHNQYLAVARTMAHIYRATKDPKYAHNARMMFATFRADWSIHEAPTWPYHWSGSPSYRGYEPAEGVSEFTPRMAGNRAVEDLAHGALDIECTMVGHTNGLGPIERDMRRLAVAFTERIVGRGDNGAVVIADSVVRSASRGGHELSVPRWTGLSQWRPEIHRLALELFNRLQPEPGHGSVLASIASLVRYKPR